MFAGIGGFDLALGRAGVDVVAAVEIDKRARGVLADRFPETTLFTDVTEVTGDDLRAAGFVPGRGVITAGWPCQGNSIAGARGGLADPRSGLWRHVVRLLAETGAAWFVGENVPGLLSVNRGADFGVILGDLVDLGLGFAWRVLDAQHFGVPQRRRRVFIVGCVGAGTRGPVEILFEPEGSGRDTSPRESTGSVSSRAAHGGVGDDRVFNWAYPRKGEIEVVPTLDSFTRDPSCNQGGAMIVSALTANMAAGGVDDNAGHLVAAPVTAREQKGPDSEVNSGNILVHALTTGLGSEDGTGRGVPLVPIAAQTVRRLTPLECERLQGFPDGWTATSGGEPQSDAARYRQAGNAVAVPVVEWIINRWVRVAESRQHDRPMAGGVPESREVPAGASTCETETETDPLFDVSSLQGCA